MCVYSKCLRCFSGNILWGGGAFISCLRYRIICDKGGHTFLYLPPLRLSGVCVCVSVCVSVCESVCLYLSHQRHSDIIMCKLVIDLIRLQCCPPSGGERGLKGTLPEWPYFQHNPPPSFSSRRFAAGESVYDTPEIIWQPPHYCFTLPEQSSVLEQSPHSL